jgi:hypothetical protein
MTMHDAFTLGATIIAGLGGGGAITLALSHFIGKMWADRALEKQRAEYQRLNTQLQHSLDQTTRRLQVELDRIGLMHKLRTTEEFSHLGLLWKKMAWLNVTFDGACSRGIRLVPKSEAGMSEYKENQRKKFLTALEDAQLFFLEEELFIPSDIAKLTHETMLFAAREPFFYASFYAHHEPSVANYYGQNVEELLDHFKTGLDNLKLMMRARITETQLSTSEDGLIAE